MRENLNFLLISGFQVQVLDGALNRENRGANR